MADIRAIATIGFDAYNKQLYGNPPTHPRDADHGMTLEGMPDFVQKAWDKAAEAILATVEVK